MTYEVIISGFGGQGVMIIGQLLAYAGMLEGKHVSFMPSYGPEMRGGTANCAVIISDTVIGNPLVSVPQVLVAMNNPSIDKFEPMMAGKGIVLTNTSIVDRIQTRADVKFFGVAANDIAAELKNAKTANIVMLGALLKVVPLIKPESLILAFEKKFAAKPELIEINKRAFECGAAAVK